MKIAISTGGGDCPGLNAVIRAVVRTAVLKYGWEVVGVRDGLDGLINNEPLIPLGLNEVRGILSRGGTIIGTTNRNGHNVLENYTRTVVENAKKQGIDAMIMVGGDGTLTIGKEVMDAGMKCCFCPKTIDNDLRATDVTFGYHTAVSIVTEALDRLETTGESHGRVMLVETMGRGNGSIAMEAGLGGSADVILIPEIPYSIDKVVEAISARKKRGRNFSVVVVAEGARPIGGDIVVQQTATSNHGVARLGGIAASVGQQIEERLDVETRTVVLGHLQRGGTPTHTDRILGTRFGVAAVDLLANGEYGKMVALRGTEIVSVPVEEAIASPAIVDVNGGIISAAESIGISFGR